MAFELFIICFLECLKQQESNSSLKLIYFFTNIITGLVISPKNNPIVKEKDIKINVATSFVDFCFFVNFSFFSDKPL